MSREARLAEYEETAELVVVVGSGRSSLASGPAADLVTRLAGRAGPGGALGVVIIRSAVAFTHHMTVLVSSFVLILLTSHPYSCPQLPPLAAGLLRHAAAVPRQLRRGAVPAGQLSPAAAVAARHAAQDRAPRRAALRRGGPPRPGHQDGGGPHAGPGGAENISE